ncbi:phosphoketolase family protein [Streptomyces sp. SCSIO 30461]|uniref:phosphoketolase family protein n=1 Tax=Streptomyces sp. SCSIO 30461 TaxID=3118085 RepID=UPI0030D56EF7
MTPTVDSAAPLAESELRALDAHWRAANYLAAGQIYLLSNPLLREPLRPEHIKPRLMGHWGTTPGLTLVYTHLNRVISSRGQDALCIWGPGHGGSAVLAGCWLEGTYTRTYPDVTRDAAGMARLFRQYSFPGGVPTNIAPETPGAVYEGGELGYSLSHAYGTALDNPDLLVACVIGDGEFETGALAASWHSNKFLSPVHDGAVLPILHVNGYKIDNPTVLARLPEEELDHLLRGLGHEPLYVSGDDPSHVHQAMASALDTAVDRIHAIQQAARCNGVHERPRWPVLVLRTPKGWTGPVKVDGVPVEGTWRSHLVPLPHARHDPGHLAQLETWLRSYRPEDLFDDDGKPTDEVLSCVPDGPRTLGASVHANGGSRLQALPVPPLEEYAVAVDEPGITQHEPTRVLSGLLRKVMEDTAQRRDFRLVGPDETTSNRLQAVYEATGKAWQDDILATDEHLSGDGRVMEILSEHTCQGWLEGYLLSGRHGLFSCYESFVHIVASMMSQHIKWLHTARQLPWRAPVASLNYLLTSHVWRQEHNGFSHQDPGGIGHVLDKSPDVVRVYLPPDTNTLLAVTEQVLHSRDNVNVVVTGKRPTFDWLSIEHAREHCARGAGIWRWAGTDDGSRIPDVVLACAGDVPTLEAVAAAGMLRRHLPDLSVRFINIVELARLIPPGHHPRGMPDEEFDALFTRDRPVIFANHGYPWLVDRLTFRRSIQSRLYVRGYLESGTTTTPFDMVVRNDLDRYRLVMDVIDRVPDLGPRAAALRQTMSDARSRHHAWIQKHGDDMPEVAGWACRS